MDARALLTSQGWRGKGHSLHPTSDATGLSRPLLVSQKQNNLGVGKKQHKTSDMWWMNAFDKSLQGLDTSEQGRVVQTVTSGGLDMVVKGGGKWIGTSGGLYASFVRGEGLGGTITPNNTEESGSEEPVGRKRKRDEGESKEDRSKRKGAKRAVRIQSGSEKMPELEAKVEPGEEKAARKAAEKAMKASKILAKEEARIMEVDGVAGGSESKEEKNARKAAQKVLKRQEPTPPEEADKMEVAENSIRAETKEERRARKAKGKASKTHQFAAEAETDTMEVDEPTEKGETKEKRREQKRQKKEEVKEKALEEMSSSKVAKKKRRKE